MVHGVRRRPRRPAVHLGGSAGPGDAARRLRMPPRAGFPDPASTCRTLRLAARPSTSGYVAPGSGRAVAARPLDAEPLANRQALREVMDHWLSLGLSGFRVDMAGAARQAARPASETVQHLARAAGSASTRGIRRPPCCPSGVHPATSVPAGFRDFFPPVPGPARDGSPCARCGHNSRGHGQRAVAAAVAVASAPIGLGSPQIASSTSGGPSPTPSGTRGTPPPTANHDFSRPLACGRARRSSCPRPPPST